MKRFFNQNTMWCESKEPRLRQACNILASEELKNFVCVAVVCLIEANGLLYLKDPFMKPMGFLQKEINSIRKIKKTPASVPHPCVLKVRSRVDIKRCINQACLFVQDFDEGQRAEVVIMIFDERATSSMSDDDRVEYLFFVITSMYKWNEGSPTYNRDKFLKQKQNVGESITEFAVESKYKL